MQGMPGQVKGKNTIWFIRRSNTPDVTYQRIVCDYREGKSNPNQMQLMADGTESIFLTTVAHQWQIC